MRLCDFINVSSEGSKLLHSYKAKESKEVYLVSKIEGERKSPLLSRKGLYRKNSITSFTVAYDPNNTGIVIRMLTDLSKDTRYADIYVDDCCVGTLYDSEHNEYSKFGDIDFNIPKSATQGKSLINIELRGTFTDFEYKIFSKTR